MYPCLFINIPHLYSIHISIAGRHMFRPQCIYVSIDTSIHRLIYPYIHRYSHVCTSSDVVSNLLLTERDIRLSTNPVNTESPFVNDSCIFPVTVALHALPSPQRPDPPLSEVFVILPPTRIHKWQTSALEYQPGAMHRLAFLQ